VAIRLPSALAALATVVLLVLFSWKLLKRPLIGFLASLILITAKGYTGAHVARSGDFDSLLTLWETGYLLAFFTFFCHFDSLKKRKWLFLTALFIALASLTKGIAGFFFMVGILIFTVLFGVSEKREENKSSPQNFGQFLSWRPTWGAALLALLPIVLFYFFRDMANPGYFSAVMENEMGGRYLDAKPMHQHPWYHYIQWMYKEEFRPWLLWVPIGIAAGLWQKGRFRKLTLLLVINALAFLVILGVGQTKIIWYAAPIYPSLSLLIAFGFERLINGAAHLLSLNKVKTYGLTALFVLAIFTLPYEKTINRVYGEQHPKWDWPVLKYRDFMSHIKGTKDYTIVHGRYNSTVKFYTNTHNLMFDAGIRHQPLKDRQQNEYFFGKGELTFQSGEKLVVCENRVFKALKKVYKYKVKWEWDTCQLLEITGEIE